MPGWYVTTTLLVIIAIYLAFVMLEHIF